MSFLRTKREEVIPPNATTPWL